MALRRAALRGDGWLAFQREELDTTQLADLLEALEILRGEAGRLEEPFSNVMRLHTSPGMASRLPAQGKNCTSVACQIGA